MDFNFHMPVHVVSGEGAVARNSTLLRTLGRRCLIITGGSSAKRSGALADVTAALDLWEIGWISFKGRVQIRRCLWHSLAQRRAQAVRFLPWLC